MITLTGPEEKLALLKNVIPDALVKEYKKVAKEGNDEKSMVFFNAQIQPIVEDYFKKCNSTKMQQGETVQWQHDVTKGIIHKEVIQTWSITNFRVMKFTFLPDGKCNQAAIGLAILDPVIMNQHRNSSGNRVGMYAGRGVGTFTSTGSSKSQSFGDLVFYVQGQEKIRFPGISDPQGVKSMVTTLKKQTKI